MGKRSIFEARRTGAAVVSVALLVAGLTALGGSAASADVTPTLPPLLQRDANVVTSDPIPTVQIDNGYVWSQTTIGSTVYAVGKFDNAREPLAAPGTSLTARSNVLAYDINSGALLSFAPQVNGVIKAVAASPDGTRIYIGGSFTSVNGKGRTNFAALDAKTGQLVSGFAPSVGGSGVYAITTSGSNVYLGGLFTQANGTARKNLAAFTATNGALLDWAPKADMQVDGMVMDPLGTNVIVAGRFAAVNDVSTRGSAAVNKTTGALDTAWALSKTVKNGLSTGTDAGKAGVWALAADATGVYGTAWLRTGGVTGNLEGSFAAEAGTGAVRWIADCLGDHYGVYSTGKVVYTTSHMHACDTMNQYPQQNPSVSRYAEAYTADARGSLGTQTAPLSSYTNWAGTPAPSAYAWAPDFTVGTKTGLGQAGLSITGSGNMISIGGEFTTVNNKRFEGLVRFSTTPPNGAKDGPRIATAAWAPTAQTGAPGKARVSIQANWDRDDLTLTYELYRAGTAAAVATKTMDSTWWNRPMITLEDTSVPKEGVPSYTVVAKDGNGNTVTSQAVTPTPTQRISHAGWKVVANTQNASYPAGNAIDGNPATYWHSEWTGRPSLPNHLTIDLGAERALTALEYTPRQDGGSNGMIGTYRVRTSLDGKSWSEILVEGQFDSTTAVQSVVFPATTTARYVRFAGMNALNGQPYTAVAEFDLFAPAVATAGGAVALDRSAWTAKADTEQAGYEAAKAFDGNTSTMWHSNWSVTPTFPHYVDINLGAAQTFASLEYTPRQDGGVNGIGTTYRIRTSNDGKTWSDILVQGTFDGTSNTQTVTFPTTTTQYVRFVVDGATNGLPYTTAAEINLYPPK